MAMQLRPRIGPAAHSGLPVRLTWRAGVQPRARRTLPVAAAAAAPTQPDEKLYTAKQPPAAWLGPVQAARYAGEHARAAASKTARH
jgi:hypothetical protein